MDLGVGFADRAAAVAVRFLRIYGFYISASVKTPEIMSTLRIKEKETRLTLHEHDDDDDDDDDDYHCLQSPGDEKSFTPQVYLSRCWHHLILRTGAVSVIKTVFYF